MYNFEIELTSGENDTTSGLQPRGVNLSGTAEAVRAIGTTIAETCSAVFEAASAELKNNVPDKLVLTFGVSISAEAGIPIVAKTNVESTFKVQATWKK